MVGLAKKLFIDKFSKAPWKVQPMHSSAAAWPLLESMVEAQCLSYVDLAFARRLLECVHAANEALGAVLCHLSMSARQGHLCVAIDNEGVSPSLEDIWTFPAGSFDNGDKPEDVMHQLSRLIQEGALNLPAALISDACSGGSFPSTPIVRQGNRYYLQRCWLQEYMFLEHAADIVLGTYSALPAVDEASVNAMADVLIGKNKLLPEQAQAVRHGCCHPFTIITGGPGTGKTHTAGHLLRVFWETLPPVQRANFRIALAAPTGKAAANLESSIRAALHSLESFPIPQAQTLHTLLGIGKESRNKAATVLPHDLLIVDESSMIDAKIMGHLMAAIKPGARLIMLGDRHQLPPVEAGSFFSDLADVLLSHPEKKNQLIEFKTCLRAELQEIVALADAIKQGNGREALRMLSGAAAEGGIRFKPFAEKSEWKKQQSYLLDYCIKYFPPVQGSLDDPMALLREYSRFRVLTPLRKGPLGVEALNAMFHQNAVKRSRREGCFAAPILVVQNDPRMDLFNGEIGLLVQPNASEDIGFNRKPHSGYAFFASKSQDKGSVRKIPLLMLPRFEYAYCLSVHKSQGSEFDHVVMVLPEGSERFGRETLYTGVTRARKVIEIWGAIDIMQKMICAKASRCSGITDSFGSYLNSEGIHGFI